MIAHNLKSIVLPLTSARRCLRVAAGIMTMSLALLSVLLLASVANAGDDQPGRELRATLKGFNEVPSKSTPASGTFRGTVSADGSSISYELTYSNLVADALFAHIHFGQKGVAGGIVVYLCNNNTPPSPPIPTGVTVQACPTRGGTITGTLTNADITTGAASQGISPGPNEFANLIEAIRGGVAYVNVHSTTFMPGEIRGQIHLVKNENE
jgi:hypothetical protein